MKKERKDWSWRDYQDVVDGYLDRFYSKHKHGDRIWLSSLSQSLRIMLLSSKMVSKLPSRLYDLSDAVENYAERHDLSFRETRMTGGSTYILLEPYPEKETKFVTGIDTKLDNGGRPTMDRLDDIMGEIKALHIRVEAMQKSLQDIRDAVNVTSKIIRAAQAGFCAAVRGYNEEIIRLNAEEK